MTDNPDAASARPTGPRIALVTGASAGFGELIAARLAERGWKVVGTSRRAHHHGPDNVDMRRLDVTDPQSVQRCVSGLIGEFGGIDLLINNAGTTHIGLAESTSEAEAQRVFETNFFGAVRMTAALLPGMRQRRRGRIITISSLAGLVPAPGQAVYAASKHAIEGYFESLSHELHGTGVEIALVEPGFFKTSLHEAATGGAATEDEGGATAGVESGYGETPEKLRAAVEKGFKGGGDPRRVAKVVVQIADAPKVRLRYRIGADAVWVPRIRRWLPPGVFDRGVRQRFGLG